MFSPFQLIWDNFDFFSFWPNFFGGGQKIRKLFPTNFLAILANLEQLRYFEQKNLVKNEKKSKLLKIGWNGEKIGRK